jgi:hypothetical protein
MLGNIVNTTVLRNTISIDIFSMSSNFELLIVVKFWED